MKTVIESDGHDIFIIVDGLKIAKRGRPGSPQARSWISLEPGWSVRDLGREKIEVRYDGALIN